MEERDIDLHIHSAFSDGEYYIREVLNMIFSKEIKVSSITDHDCIDSCKYMDQYNLAMYGTESYQYIRGVEISSKMGQYDAHILGYNFNYTENMEKLLYRIKELRKEHFLALIEKIRQIHGIHITPEDIHNLILKPGIVGKVHVIKLLHNNGCEGTGSEINQRFIRGIKTGICFDANVEESIEVIKEAKGIPVLAHPKEIENKYHININEIIKNFIDVGIEGIEVYNSLHTLEDIKRFLEIAKKYSLLISGGSDFHGGFVKKGVEIGNASQEKIKIKQLSLVDRINEIGIAA